MFSRKISLAFVALLLAATQLMGCAAIKGIFKAGVWVGVLAVLCVVGVLFAVTRAVART